MKNVGLIPCRLESTRLPNKPIELIQGIPMFAHVYFRSKISKLDEIYICTDSEEIVDISNKFEIKSVLTSKDHLNGTTRCAEAARTLELDDGDIVIDIQGDEPLLDPKDINKMINFFDIKKHEIVLGYLKTTDENNKNIVKLVTSDEGKVLYFSRYDIPMNFKIDRTLKKQVGLVGFKNNSLQAFCDIKPNVFEETEGIELLRVIDTNMKLHGVELQFENRSVDTPEDLEFVRNAIIADQLFQKYKHKGRS